MVPRRALAGLSRRRVSPLGPAEATTWYVRKGWELGPRRAPDSVMILPQVHLRKPCYDFYFL
jgi:hypothetical protein